MEAVERIKDATFDINTIGLYDAELDRKWKEEAKIAVGPTSALALTCVAVITKTSSSARL